MSAPRQSTNMQFDATPDGERSLTIDTSEGVILFLAANDLRHSDISHFLSIDHGTPRARGQFSAICGMGTDAANHVLRLDLAPSLNSGRIEVYFTQMADLDAATAFIEANL